MIYACRIFGVNFKALINMGQAMAKSLEKNKITSGGSIVNVSSVVSTKGICKLIKWQITAT